MSKLTFDRQGFYIDETLSENQALTPEGFLLCRNVPIARTGEQLYKSEEVGLEPRGDGLVKVMRDADQVFSPETIASFEGKDITIDHPDGGVNPQNWRQLTVGNMQNVRRGDGIQDDLLLADFLIKDQRGIKAVREKGLREVSCGYDADYVQIEPGIGRQENIIGNHVALVERGRAGPRCSIQDKEPDMKSKAKKPTWLDRMRSFLDSEEEAMKKEETKDADDEPQEEVKTEDEDSGVEARLERIEAILAKLVPVEEAEHQESFDAEMEEEDCNTQDEGDLTEAETAESNTEAEGKVWTGDSLKAIRSRAEILAPGVKLATADSAKSNAGERLMRLALTKANQSEVGAECIKPFIGNRSIAKLTGDSLHSVFTGASELMRAKNNSKGVRSGISTKDFGATSNIEQINARNREFWANRK